MSGGQNEKANASFTSYPPVISTDIPNKTGRCGNLRRLDDEDWYFNPSVFHWSTNRWKATEKALDIQYHNFREKMLKGPSCDDEPYGGGQGAAQSTTYSLMLLKENWRYSRSLQRLIRLCWRFAREEELTLIQATWGRRMMHWDLVTDEILAVGPHWWRIAKTRLMLQFAWFRK